MHGARHFAFEVVGVVDFVRVDDELVAPILLRQPQAGHAVGIDDELGRIAAGAGLVDEDDRRIVPGELDFVAVDGLVFADDPGSPAAADGSLYPGRLAGVAAVPDRFHQIGQKPPPAPGFLDAAGQQFDGLFLARVFGIVGLELPGAVDRRHLAFLQHRLDKSVAPHGQGVLRKMAERFVPTEAIGPGDRVKQAAETERMRNDRLVGAIALENGQAKLIDQPDRRFVGHEMAPS